jgi:hypothetical protein
MNKIKKFIKKKPFLSIVISIVSILLAIAIWTFFNARISSAAWYNNSWLYRKELVINNSAQPTNLIDFPTLVVLSNTNFNFSQAQTLGQDLRFTDSDGTTLLSYEIESYDNSAQTAKVWVKVPQIDASSSTDSIFVYWGNNSATDAQSADNTWNSNYKGVYHLSDNTASTSVTDSSGNTNTLTASENTNNGFSQSTGKISNSFLTGGTPTYITDQSGSNITELYPDMALDSSGFPVIVYYDLENTDLIVVHCNDKECKGGDENVNIVDSTNNTGRYPTIQLDSNGYPMIAYQYATGLDLKYVHCNDVNCAGSNETFTTIETSNNVGYYPRMVLDSSGYPVIVHYSSTAGDVRIYHCSHVDCTSGTANIVDSSGTVGNNIHGTDLVLNSSGYPVVSYYDTTNSELKVATCSDANCATVVTKSPLSTLSLIVGFYTSIELDGSGLPMIAYYDSSNTDLVFLHCDDVLCDGVENANRVVVDAGNAVMPSLEKDSSGLPVIAAHSGSGIYPRVYLCADTSCSSSTSSYLALYSQYSVNNAINIKLDSSNNVYAVAMPKGKTGQYDAVLYTSANKLERAYDADFDFGTSSFSASTWFKSNGMVQNNYLMSRYDADQGFKIRLNYAGQPCFEIDDDSTWGADDSACSSNSQIVTNVDNGNATNALYVSMELDSSGFPVIAYYDNNANDLELIHCNDANCTGNNESFASIDTGGAVGLYNSMVLDSSGYPVIAYYDITNANLKVVHCGHVNCTSGNTINTIDSTGDVGIYPSIKLDSSGFPIVAYTDTTNSSVKVVHCNDALCAGANETTTTVVNTEDDRTRSNSALQLDSSGFPIIVFSDQTNDDLELVHCNDVDCAGNNETRTEIESTNLVGGYASMVLDSSGFPVIAFWDETNFDLRVVHCGNVNCDSGNTTNAITMTNDGELGFTENEIKLNSSGYPVILSQQSGSWSMVLVVCNDVNCSGNDETISRIRDNDYINFYHSLELDSNNYPVMAFTPNGNDLRLIHMTNATTYTDSGNYDDGEWHQLVAVKNGTTSITLYVDGVSVGTDTSLSATGTLTSNSATLNLAQEIENGLGLNNWTGYIDEVQIDSTARSSDWVKAQYLNESNNFITANSSQSRFGTNLSIFTNNSIASKANLVVHYKFNEGNGTTTKNSGSAGTTHSATISNATWTSEGKFDHALVYNGTSSYTQLGTTDLDTYFEALDNWSISTWVNINAWTNEGAVFSNRYADTEIVRLYTNGTTGQLLLQTRDSGNTATNQTVTGLTANTWYHVVINRTYNSTLDIYINGVLKSTTADTRTGDFISEAGSHEYFVGRTIAAADWVTWKYFTGKIDEVKIYNDALTADEIKLDFNKGSSIQLGSFSDTSLLTGGSVASNSASAIFCVPGGADSCNAPIGEWKFEESSWVNDCATATAMDTSGNGNNLTSCPNGTGQSNPEVGKYGKAPSLDGVNDYFESSSTQLGLSGAITMEAWVKPTATSVNDDYFINRTSSNAGYAFGWASAMLPKIRIGNGTSYSDVSGTTVLAVGTWYHLTATIDGSGNANIYVNGKLDTSSTTGILATVTQDFRIGTRTLGSNEIAAVVDEVKIFNYARTPSQVAWDFNQGKPIVHYKFDDCTGTSLNDSSGNAKHATITIGGTGSNTTTGTCTTSGAWFDGADGKFNSSLDFDGTDDQAISDEPTGSYVFEQDFTASIWIKTTASAGTILHKATASGGSIFMLDNSAGIIRFSRYDGEFSPSAYSTTVTNTGTWTHILATKKDSILTLYINAKPESVITDDITGGGSGTDFTTYISNSSAGVHYFTGQLDDARVYNYALTPAQIKMVYNEGSAVRFGP